MRSGQIMPEQARTTLHLTFFRKQLAWGAPQGGFGWENVNFFELEHCYENGINSEGSFNVYNSEIKMKNILFYKNLKGDDGINFVSSKFNIENVKFEKILSDCLDIDYSIGEIKNIQYWIMKGVEIVFLLF